MDATSTSIHSGFSTSLPIKYSFAFSKIYRNIPPVYFVSLFVVRLKNNINISFLFFHFFQNILEKYFSKHEISIFNENNKRGEKYRNSFRYKSKSKSKFSFHPLSKKRIAFQIDFQWIKSCGKKSSFTLDLTQRVIITKLSLLLLLLLLLFRGKKERKKHPGSKRLDRPSFYSPVSRSDRVISCSGCHWRRG